MSVLIIYVIHTGSMSHSSRHFRISAQIKVCGGGGM
jgi:hypothetical protein